MIDNMDIEQERRRVLLEKLLTTHFKNNKSELGKFLGYKDGAFVRQMLSGTRGISEKTVSKVQASPRYARWFDPDTAQEDALSNFFGSNKDYVKAYEAAPEYVKEAADKLLELSEEKQIAAASYIKFLGKPD